MEPLINVKCKCKTDVYQCKTDEMFINVNVKPMFIKLNTFLLLSISARAKNAAWTAGESQNFTTVVADI